MAKVKFIDKSIKKECYICKGKDIECNNCDGTGTYRQTFYHLIYTDKKGNKMAFGVDTIK